jgi:acyl carrier protein
MANTTDDIIKIIAEYLGVSTNDIDRHANLRDDLNLGSIELNDLLNQISEQLEVSFDPEDVSQLHTVDDLIVLVEDNLL